jgi:sialate O-acetylesterase
VSCPQVTDPTAVRYAWADDPVSNLVNASGLPAGPFRSDQPHYNQ